MPFVEVEGARLHYVDVGTGDPPVVLLHAFPLQSDMWGPQVACLAAGRRVIAPDLKGFGKSSAPDDVDAYSMTAYADEVAGLLRHLGVERMVLGGLSMGGYVALSFMAAHADMVEALVLADTRAGRDAPEVLQRRTDQQEQVRRDGISGPDGSGLLETLLAGLLSPAAPESRPQLVGQVRRMMSSNPPAGYIGALEAMKNRPDSTERLASIAVPTLVLVGEHDAAAPPEVVGAWQEQIPGSQLFVVPGAGHLSNLEAPDVFNAAVADFLDRL